MQRLCLSRNIVGSWTMGGVISMSNRHSEEHSRKWLLCFDFLKYCLWRSLFASNRAFLLQEGTFEGPHKWQKLLPKLWGACWHAGQPWWSTHYTPCRAWKAGALLIIVRTCVCPRATWWEEVRRSHQTEWCLSSFRSCNWVLLPGPT